MESRFWLGMAVILVSGILNGSFPLPLKYSREWRWENTWLAFSIFSLLAFPWILAGSFEPHLLSVFHRLPASALAYPLIFGFLWGISQVTFGLSIDAVGMAVAIAVVSGLACVFGSLIPLAILSPADLLRPRGILLIISLPILVAGLFYCGVAGKRRDRETPENVKSSAGAGKKSFMAGLGICIFTGIFTSTYNFGLAFSGPIMRQARQLGASLITSSYAVWVLVFAAGFIPNLVYCAYLLSRSGTWRRFLIRTPREAALSAAMAALWVAGVFGYGMGATLVGRYGTSVGFTLFMAMSILVSNFLGVLAGEWKRTSIRTRRSLAAGVAFIILSAVVLNLGGLF